MLLTLTWILLLPTMAITVVSLVLAFRKSVRVAGTLRVMHLGKDDALVLEVEQTLTQTRAADVEMLLQREFPGHKVVVLHGGWKLSTIRPGEGLVRRGRYEATEAALPNPPPRRPSTEGIHREE